MDYAADRGNAYRIRNGGNQECFNLTILKDDDKECNENFAFKVELKLGMDRRRLKFPDNPDNQPYTYGRVIINETCMRVYIIWKCNQMDSRYTCSLHACSTWPHSLPLSQMLT